MEGKNPVFSCILNSQNATGTTKDFKARANYLNVEDWSCVRHNHMSKPAYCGVKMEEGQVFGMILS